MQRSSRILAALTAVLTAALAFSLAAPAAHGAEGRLVIRGAGFGHGVGMSQYGALGMAKQGWDHRRILAHYYSGTALGTVDPGRPVRVLLGGRRGVTRVAGAAVAGGRPVDPGKTYGLRARADGRVELLSPKGRVLRAAAAPLRLAGTVPIAVEGRGAYRGAIEVHPGGGGLDLVNVVGLDDYVRGVVARESPSSWPAAALQAQAVAARTYAITTVKGVSPAWEHYADTRSQVYGGVGAETPTTDAAVAATAGQVVTHEGRPVVTYFFSTSGGRTEDVENSLGGAAQPWLRSVPDPFDAESPRHRWAPRTMTLDQAGGRLRGLVRGSFRGIDVLRRGRSPRIVAAEVVGSKGRTRVTGAQLRARLGLYDTWAFFTGVSTEEDAPRPEGEPVAPLPDAAPTGGIQAQPSRRRPVATLTGHVVPARAGTPVVVQRRRGPHWQDAGVGEVGASGSYRVAVQHRGPHRVVVAGVAGPVVRVSGRTSAHR